MLMILLAFAVGMEGRERGREKSRTCSELTVQDVSALYEEGWTRPDVVWTRVAEIAQPANVPIYCVTFCRDCSFINHVPCAFYALFPGWQYLCSSLRHML